MVWRQGKTVGPQSLSWAVSTGSGDKGVPEEDRGGVRTAPRGFRVAAGRGCASQPQLPHLPARGRRGESPVVGSPCLLEVPSCTRQGFLFLYVEGFPFEVPPSGRGFFGNSSLHQAGSHLYICLRGTSWLSLQAAPICIVFGPLHSLLLIHLSAGPSPSYSSCCTF